MESHAGIKEKTGGVKREQWSEERGGSRGKWQRSEGNGG
jgi:hypothetical protein